MSTRPDAPPLPPPAASARRYLRDALPAIYAERPYGGALFAGDAGPPPVMGLLEGLEQVLDPIVALLDNLSQHLDPALAPAAIVDFLAELVGAPVDPTLPLAARRRLLAAAARIAAARGTHAGLLLALQLAFPELEPAVHDGGATTWARDPEAVAPAPPAAFEVHVAHAPTAAVQAQIARCVADHRPVGATYRVVVGAGEGG